MSVPVPSTPTNPADRPGVDVAQHAMDQHPFVTPTRVLATSAVEALIRAGWQSPRMAAAPAVPATQGDLREQVANALADSNLREVGDDGTLVRPFAAKSPMAFAYADAALSVVNPVLEGLRAEIVRLCEDLHRAKHDRDYYRKVAAEWSDARPSVSDQTPATPANSGEWCNCQSANTWHPVGDTADCAPSSVQGDTTPKEA